jgi:hypothetical protein
MPKSQKGEINPRAKLTMEKILMARDRFKLYDKVDGISAIARELGVSHDALSRAISGETWRV